jgi:hypothetical protein
MEQSVSPHQDAQLEERLVRESMIGSGWSGRRKVNPLPWSRSMERHHSSRPSAEVRPYSRFRLPGTQQTRPCHVTRLVHPTSISHSLILLAILVYVLTHSCPTVFSILILSFSQALTGFSFSTFLSGHSFFSCSPPRYVDSCPRRDWNLPA